MQSLPAVWMLGQNSQTPQRVKSEEAFENPGYRFVLCEGKPSDLGSFRALESMNATERQELRQLAQIVVMGKTLDLRAMLQNKHGTCVWDSYSRFRILLILS